MSSLYVDFEEPPIAWSKMCKPKDEEGLEFQNLKAWNLTLLVKVLWRIQQKQDTLWISWVHHTYLKQKDLWSWRAKHLDSSLNKMILQICDTILTATHT